MKISALGCPTEHLCGCRLKAMLRVIDKPLYRPCQKTNMIQCRALVKVRIGKLQHSAADLSSLCCCFVQTAERQPTKLHCSALYCIPTLSETLDFIFAPLLLIVTAALRLRPSAPRWTVFLSRTYISSFLPFWTSSVRFCASEQVTSPSEQIAGVSIDQVAFLPDYSGNRFMSSLGNIYSDGVAGITIPLMQKGRPIDVVYLTGDAKVLLGKDSTRVFPGVNTCVRIKLTGFMHVKDAVPLIPGDGVEDFEQKGQDGIGWSPYNPPVRRLASELSSLSSSDAAMKAAEKYNGEKELNDTGVRTWTISSAPRSSEEQGVKVTIRRVEKGLVTPKLFELGKKGDKGARLPVLGVGGDFVLPSNIDRKLLWVASGVGIRPFLSFLSSLSHSTTTSLDITLILAVRRAEAQPILNLVSSSIASATGAKGNLGIHVLSAGLTDSDILANPFRTGEGAFETSVTKHSARLSPELLVQISGEALAGEAWVCGPPALETMVMQTLEKAGWEAERVHRESFAF